MDKSDMKNLGEQELSSAIEEKRDALRVARFSFSVGKLKTSNQYREIRRELARLLTEERRRDREKVNES